MFSTGGIPYADWKGMDLAEYYEAREAYIGYRGRIEGERGG